MLGELGRKRSKFPVEEDTVRNFYLLFSPTPSIICMYARVYIYIYMCVRANVQDGMAVVGNKVNRVAFREMDLLYRRLSPFIQINDLSFNYESSWGN